MVNLNLQECFHSEINTEESFETVLWQCVSNKKKVAV